MQYPYSGGSRFTFRGLFVFCATHKIFHELQYVRESRGEQWDSLGL